LQKTIYTLFFLLFWCAWHTPLHSQQVWPGDVDNNGIVEHIDVLYLGYAFGSTGPPRPGGYTNFTGQNLEERWDDNFPDGINYGYADTDGNGTINGIDIIAVDTFYGKTHGEVLFFKEFMTGNGAPPLTAIPEQSTAMGEESISFSFELGSPEQPVEDFYGVAFSFRYDTSYMRIIPDSFAVAADSWILGSNTSPDSLLILIKDKPLEGRVDVAITRRDQQGVTGHGPIATATIVIETIVIGPAEQDIKYGVDSVFLIDEAFSTLPVTWTEGALNVPAVKTRAIHTHIQPEVFPNPVFTRQFRLALPDFAQPIQTLYLSDASGRLHAIPFRQLSAGNYSAAIPASFSAGFYLLMARGNNEYYRTSLIVH